MEQEIKDAVAPGDAEFLDATRLATGLMGDSIATNLFMVGYAYQRGLIPVSEAAILKAIELNGAAVESNTRSFQWGRLAVVDPERVAAAAIPAEARPDSQRLSQSLAEMIERRDQVPHRISGCGLRATVCDAGRQSRRSRSARDAGHH